MAYADVEYLDDVYFDAEFLYGSWWIFEGKTGEVRRFELQNSVRPLNQVQPSPRHRKIVLDAGRFEDINACRVMRIPGPDSLMGPGQCRQAGVMYGLAAPVPSAAP